jgi:hypothetical protein
VFAAHRGEEIDTQGDSFFVAFRSASDALSAAAAVRPRRLVDVDAIGLDRLRSASADGLTALTGCVSTSTRTFSVLLTDSRRAAWWPTTAANSR